MESLRVTLKEAREFNREEALTAAGKEYREEQIAVNLVRKICKDLGIPFVK